MSKIITADNELTINNPILENLREDLNNALKLAVISADGNNVVTVNAKIVIESVVFHEDYTEIKDLKHQVKVSEKNNIWDNEFKAYNFRTSKDEDGIILAYPEQDPQLSMDELAGEDDQPEVEE